MKLVLQLAEQLAVRLAVQLAAQLAAQLTVQLDVQRVVQVDALRNEQPSAPDALKSGFATTSADEKHVVGTCNECDTVGEGWLDPDIAEFFCTNCWNTFSPDVLRCAACRQFLPWSRGAVSPERRMWECHECRSGMD